jgi:replicative DNA helicase
MLTKEASRLVVQGPGDLTNAADLLPGLVEDIEARKRADGVITGIRTGIEELDDLTYGFDPGDLVVIAADPGGGKTALAMQIAILLAILDGGTALVCNMEMSKKALLERAIAYLAGIDSWSLRTGRLSKPEWSAFYEATTIIEKGLLILEDRVFTMPQIVTRSRAWRARFPRKRGIIVVDYLQRIRGGGGRGENRAEQIGEWTSALKELGTSLEVPVVLLSQLNRAPSKEKRPPTMRDLRESGDIEADADTVLLIHNAGKTENGTTDLILDKNRRGPCRTLTAHWTAKHYRFSNAPNESPRQQVLPGAA